jgi:hypothetical protein
MNKSAEEVEREVEATRGSIDRTVEALKDKMTPPQIFDEVMQGMGSAGSKMVNTLGDQVRENPVPLALIGLGLAWLVVGSRRDRAPDYYAERRSFASDQDYGYASSKPSLKERAGEAVSNAKAKIGDAVSGLGEMPVAERAQALAGSAMDAADQAKRRAQQTFDSALDRDPLIIGALGVVVGAAIGAAIPASRVENRYAGPLRDKVVDKTKVVAQEGLDTVREAAQAAYGSVKEELGKQDPANPQSLADRAGQAAKAGIQAVQDELHNRPH